jgi:chaperonin GroEL
VISADRGLKVEDAEVDMLGTARRLVANKDESTIIEGKGDDKAIKERLDQLRVQIEETSSDYDREKLQERMAALVGGVAVLKIGGATEPEINERKSRAEDALSATRAAIEEGIVAGGGVALVRAGHVLDALEKTVEGDQALGVRMVHGALSAPLILISENAGHEGQVVLEGVRNGEADWGFDADRGEYCNLIEAGIIDPVKVTRSALENAGSIAGMMMTTQAIITEIPEFVPLPQDIQDFMHD